MSMKQPVLIGVRLFLRSSDIILKSLTKRQSTNKSDVQVNVFFKSDSTVKYIQNQLIPERNHIFARIHSSNIVFCKKPTPDPSEKAKRCEYENQLSKKKEKKPLGQRILQELRHYYHGFKLLFMNARIALGLTIKRLRGKKLTRREYNLLKRTAKDIFRLFPFSVFLIVPFMELTLPIFLKMFPGMLPTTFLTKKDKREKAKKVFKAKLEMTKFLHDTLDDMTPLTITKESSEMAKDFSDFFSKIRTTGQIPSSADILKYSKLFEDEITLDKLSRAQIIALCRFLNIPPIGTTRFLRFQLKLKIRNIQIDDKVIKKEGINTLTAGELKEACRVRGMRFYGISERRLREQLDQWLDLSIVKKIPPSLLLLSQALSLSHRLPNEKSIATTIQSLPSEVGTATRSSISEREGKFDFETEIRLLKDEVIKIKEESMETQLEFKMKEQRFMVDPEKESEEEAKRIEIRKKKMAEDLSTEELAALADALMLNVYIDKDCIAELKNDLESYGQNIKELEDAIFTLNQPDLALESLAAKRLHKKLIKLLNTLDEALVTLEKREIESHSTPCFLQYKSRKPGTVKIEELLDLMKTRRIKEPLLFRTPDQIANILNMLDTNNDGFVRISKVLELVDILSNEGSVIRKEYMEEYVKAINNQGKLDELKRLGCNRGRSPS